MPKYRTHFELDIKDIDRIEVSLTKRVGDLTRRILDSDAVATDTKGAVELREEIQELRGLLGKIHEQKIWYDPKEYHPRG